MVKIPEIEYQFSGPITECTLEGFSYPRVSPILHPTDEQSDYLSKLDDLWKIHGVLELEEIAKITGLDWEEERITIYVTKYASPISRPVIIPQTKNPLIAHHISIHELIHQHIGRGRNADRLIKGWDWIDKDFKDESFITRNHIPLHAIHTSLYLKIFGESELAWNFKYDKKHPEYNRSWEIVQSLGHEKVLEEFFPTII